MYVCICIYIYIYTLCIPILILHSCQIISETSELGPPKGGLGETQHIVFWYGVTQAFRPAVSPEEPDFVSGGALSLLLLHIRSEAMTSGPRSLEALLDWPCTLSKCLTQEMRNRIMLLLQDGLVGHSDFSGRRCCETSLEMLLAGLRHLEVPIARNAVQWWRACEKQECPHTLPSF